MLRLDLTHPADLPSHGLIYGFISREECDSLLQMQRAVPGSFLYSVFGQLCRSVRRCLCSETLTSIEPKHYLVQVRVPRSCLHRSHLIDVIAQQADVEKKGLLPDFLRSCDKLRYLLQRVWDPTTDEINLKPVPKDDVLEAYYSKGLASRLPPGYSVLI